MNTILDNMHLLSDTELRIVLIISSTTEMLSVQDLQDKTHRGRQVYTALQSLKDRDVILQSNPKIVGSVRKYKWSCMWNNVFDRESVQVTKTEKLEIPTKSRTKTARGATNPNQQHVAVKIYTEVTHRRPKQFVADVIASAVASEGEDLNQWKSIVELWILSGWNPNNIDGMLDMYNKRNQPKELRVKKRVVLRNDSPQKTEAETSAMLSEYLKENGVFNEEN
jgi:hypothetical protein